MEDMSSTIRDIYRDLHNDFFAAIENIKEYIFRVVFLKMCHIYLKSMD